MSYVYDPVHWRNRARSMRAAAEAADNVHIKTMMLELADDYVGRAERADTRIAAPSQPSALPPLDLSGYRRKRRLQQV
jgi:hypothetical protein